MRRELVLHPIAYTTLIGGCLAAIGFSFLVWPDKNLLRLGFLALGVAYVLWGVWVHTRIRDLTRTMVLEYIGAASVAVLLLWLITI